MSSVALQKAGRGGVVPMGTLTKAINDEVVVEVATTLKFMSRGSRSVEVEVGGGN